MQYRALIPNTFTMANLLCGCLAIYQVSTRGDYGTAALLIGLAAFLDVFDGLTARMLGVAGDMGKQLDSLADAVSFGVAPALMVVDFAARMAPEIEGSWWQFLPLLLAIASVYRLAKFNLDTRQTDGFRGLPTPANALFWIALVQVHTSNHPWSEHLTWPLLVALVLAFSAWMVSDTPLIALKFKGSAWHENRFRYTMIAAVVLLASLSCLLYKSIFPAVPILIPLYLLISLMSQRSKPQS